MTLIEMSYAVNYRSSFKQANSIGIYGMRVLQTVSFVSPSADDAANSEVNNSPSGIQEISRNLWKPKAHYRVFHKVTLIPILILTNPVCEIPLCLFNTAYACPIHSQLYSITPCYWLHSVHVPNHMYASHKLCFSGEAVQVPWLCVIICNKFILYVT